MNVAETFTEILRYYFHQTTVVTFIKSMFQRNILSNMSGIANVKSSHGSQVHFAFNI